MFNQILDTPIIENNHKVYYPPKELKNASIYETEEIKDGIQIYRRPSEKEGIELIPLTVVQSEVEVKAAIRLNWKAVQDLYKML